MTQIRVAFKNRSSTPRSFLRFHAPGGFLASLHRRHNPTLGSIAFFPLFRVDKNRFVLRSEGSTTGGEITIINIFCRKFTVFTSQSTNTST